MGWLQEGNLKKLVTLVSALVLALVLVGCKDDKKKQPSGPKNLQAQVNAFVIESGVPAAAYGYFDTLLVEQAVSGKLTVDGPSKIVVSDPLPLGSNSKAITATLIARLIQQNKLTWSSTLAELLPDFASNMHPAYKTLTIESMLRHRSGLIPITEQDEIEQVLAGIGGLVGDVAADRKALVEWALKQPPRFTPNSKTEYCNVNYILAGYIAEQLMHEEYETLVRKEVFIPLGLNAYTSVPSNGVKGHFRNAQYKWASYTPSETDEYLLKLGLAAGGWVMAIDQYEIFVRTQALGLKGQLSFLSQENFRRMHTADMPDAMGIGWQIKSITTGTSTKVYSQHLGSDDVSYQMGALISQDDSKGVVYFVNGYESGVLAQAGNLAVSMVTKIR